MFEKLVAPKTEEEITNHWKYIDKIYVSIICITYNHDEYLGEAIDSFLAQKSDYKFEIIIHDDASTDKTTSILKKYADKYPNIIKPIYNEINQYSQNVNLPVQNCNKIAQGCFIAFCEGDDYWVDEYKLQQQIKFLESNSSFGLVLTDYHSYNQETGEFNYNIISKNKDEYLSRLNFESFLTNFGYFSPMSWLLKRTLWNEVTNYNEQHLDGTFVWLLKILKISKVKVLMNTTVVHRHIVESATKSSNINKLLIRNESLLNTQLEFHKKFNLDESLIKKFNQVHFILNVNTLFSKKVTTRVLFKLFNDFKFSYISAMRMRELLKLIYIFMPLPNSLKFSVLKLVMTYK